MKAACWHAPHDVRVDTVPDPRILNPRDAIVRVSSASVTGDDVRALAGFAPGFAPGDTLGREFMGEVVAIGSGVHTLGEGDRVVVPAVVACGSCHSCKRGQFSCCENSSPNPVESRRRLGYHAAGVFGTPPAVGGYPGGHAELVRVPYADVGPIKVPRDLPDDRALLLSDTLPAAWAAAEDSRVEPGDVVAVWGCGAVGLLVIRSLRLMGAERVIAIDGVPHRLEAAARAGAETLSPHTGDLAEHLDDLTAGRGPDACIDAAGMEPHPATSVVGRLRQAMNLDRHRPPAPHEILRCVRKGGVVSIVGSYARHDDCMPLHLAAAKGVTIRMARADGRRHSEKLLDLVLSGTLDPREVVTHALGLQDAAHAYRLSADRADGCVRVVLKPGAATPRS